MKVKYLATLTAASILSLGLVTSCATPDAGETNTGDPGVTEVDPGVETAPELEPDATLDPCAGVDSGADVDPVPSADPCAGQ